MNEADFVNVLERIHKCNCQLNALSKFYEADLCPSFRHPSCPRLPHPPLGLSLARLHLVSAVQGAV